MSTNSTPKYYEAPDWRAQGHCFQDLEPDARGFVRSQLEIPANTVTIIPAQNLSVLDLIHAPLPPIRTQGPAGDTYSVKHQLFSSELPDTTHITALLSIPIPPLNILHRLKSDAAQEWLDGSNSVAIAKNEGFHYLPLWIISVWTQIILDVVPARELWTCAVTWLRREELNIFQDTVNNCLSSLASLSWYTNLSPLLSTQSSHSFSKSTLAQYMSRKWLTDAHVDQLMALIQNEIESRLGTSQRICFLDTILIRKIIHLYNSREDGSQVYDPADTSFISKFGQTLATAHRAAGIFHVRSNHWVAIVIDIQAQDLLYGDSTGAPPDKGTTSALRWFLAQHIPAFDVDTLDD
ncbi:hypothetical protein CVT24_002722, partial [Panaeolus cyanescens]